MQSSHRKVQEIRVQSVCDGCPEREGVGLNSQQSRVVLLGQVPPGDQRIQHIIASSAIPKEPAAKVAKLNADKALKKAIGTYISDIDFYLAYLLCILLMVLHLMHPHTTL